MPQLSCVFARHRYGFSSVILIGAEDQICSCLLKAPGYLWTVRSSCHAQESESLVGLISYNEPLCLQPDRKPTLGIKASHWEHALGTHGKVSKKAW